jgi:MFS transporter, ACS family, D-galactonate transporter
MPKDLSVPAQTGRPTRVRAFMVGLIFIAVVISYLDRSSLAIAAPFIRHSLQLSSVQMGLVFSAFAWAYSPLQIPGSMLVDRVRPRLLYPAIIAVWSAMQLMLGFSSSLLQLFLLRMGLGGAEAPSFPMNNRIVTTWLPENERARGVGVFVSGQYVGLAFCTPILAFVTEHFGWRAMFIMIGSIGIVWAFCFRQLYRDPIDSQRANADELSLIRAGGGQVAWTQTQTTEGTEEAAVPAARAFRNRKLWGLLLAHSGETAANWFFLTWFPIYLVHYRHIAFLKAGFLATLPFIAAYCGVLLSGFLSDRLLRRGYSLSFARKAPIVTGLVLATSIIGANFVQSPALIIGFMTVAFFGSGLSAISWSLVSSIAPVNLVGLASGAFNFVGTSMGITVPLVIGFLVRGGSFAPALSFVGGMALLSTCSYLFIIGKIERVR